MNAVDWYQGRIAEWTGRRDAEAASGVLVSRLRLASFLGGIASLWWGLGWHQSAGVVAGIAGFAAFGVLVAVHARILDRVERADTGRRLGVQGVARLERDWNALPEVPPPSGLDFDAHPYARDLDVFGHASVTKWLGRPATTEGARVLFDWLLAPAGSGEIPARQAAVEELAPKREWRESLAVDGQLMTIGAREIARFLEWVESEDHAVPPAFQVVAMVLPVTIWILLALSVTEVTDGAWWLIPVTLGIVMSFRFALRVQTDFDRAALGARALRRYVSMLSLVCDETWTSPELVRLREAMCIGGQAPSLLARLARIAEWSELRGQPLIHFPIQTLTLWDFHLYFALERWRRRSGKHVRGWIEALAAVDALATLSMIRADEPGWTTPLVDPAAGALVGKGLGHPLIPARRRIVNDVEVGPTGTTVLITGSNMSGKSTLLRAIGLNTVLAQAGAPVCAGSFVMPPADLQTSIRIQDSLELGLSYFMAALARLKLIVDAAEKGVAPGRVLMYLLDEVLQGTNSVERGIAVRAVVRHLLDARAIGAITTHDLGLADEEPIKSTARLAHFTEQVHGDGTMTFDYRLRPGLATSSNALRLMQLIGITPR